MRGFFDASRQAFLGDGQKYNWRIQRAYFPHFEAVADFLHVLCYLYRGAWAVGADEAGRWRQFEAWMRACWQGRVGEVLSESAAWQERLGRPPPEADGSDPRRVVKDVERYLWNNRERMDYRVTGGWACGDRAHGYSWVAAYHSRFVPVLRPS